MAKIQLRIMKKLIVILIFLVVYIVGNAQNDIAKLVIAKALVEQVEKGSNTYSIDSTLYLSTKALNVLKTIDTKKVNKTEYYKLIAQSYNNIGTCAYFSGKISNALENYHKALKIRERLNDNKGLIESNNNIALIYKRQNDTIQATKLFKKALRLAQQEKDNEEISKILNNLGGLCSAKNANLSLSYYLKSLDIEEKLGNLTEIGKREQNIATAYQNLNDISNAKKWYLKSIATKTKTGDKIGLATTYNALSQLYLEINRYGEGEQNAKKAYAFAFEENNLDNLILASEKLYDIYYHKKLYVDAIKKLEEISHLKEERLILANEKETEALQLKYDYDKKLETFELKSKLEKQALNLKIKSEQQKQIGLSLFILLTIGFSSLMYNRFKKTKKQKLIIEDQKKLVEHKNQEITDSINYAKRIQHTLLANDELLRKNLSDYFVLFKPKDIVSGDFYWASEQENDFYIASCDSTGHGVPGAFMSLLNISFLNEAVNEKNILEPHEILNYVRKRLIDNIGQDGGQDGMDGTLVRINKQSKEITYASAYNSPIVISQNSIIYLSSNRMAVGKSPYEHKSFDLFKLDYKKDDVLYLYTDGFPDQFGGEKGKKFKLKQLQEQLLTYHDIAIKNQGALLDQLFEEWKGAFEQVDDILVIGIKL